MPSCAANGGRPLRLARAGQPEPGHRRRLHPRDPRRPQERCPPPDARGSVEAALLQGRVAHPRGIRPAGRPPGPGAGAGQDDPGSRPRARAGRRRGQRAHARRDDRRDGPPAPGADPGRGRAPDAARGRVGARLGFRPVLVRGTRGAARRRAAVGDRRARGAARLGAQRSKRRDGPPGAGRRQGGAAPRGEAVGEARGAAPQHVGAVGPRAGQRRLLRFRDRGPVPDGRGRGATRLVRPVPGGDPRGGPATGPLGRHAGLLHAERGARRRHRALGRARSRAQRRRPDDAARDAPAAGAREVRRRAGDRPRLDGSRPARPRPRDRPARGGEADPDLGAADAARVGEVQGALLPRGARRGQAAAPGHRGDLRRRAHRRGDPVHRDGVRRGAHARGTRPGQGAAARAGAAPVPGVPRRARVRALAGRRPPRPEAGEHHDHRRRAPEDHGLRRRARRRLADDPGRRDPRQPPLHGPRAARQGKGGSAHGSLRLRRRALLDAHRSAPLHRRLLRGHRPGRPVGAARVAEGSQAARLAAARQDRAPLPGEGPGQALRDRERAQEGAARRRRAAARQPAERDPGPAAARRGRLAPPVPQPHAREPARERAAAGRSTDGHGTAGAARERDGDARAARETDGCVGCARESSDDELFRKSLPLTFTAKHSHRIGSCTGSLRLEDWGVEFRSREHDPWRWRFGEIRAVERENARSLHVEAGGKDYNFSFVGKPPTDADWARYRKLARK